MATVTKGLYYGFDQDDLDAELAKYKSAVKQHTAMRDASGGGGLSGGSVNGEQVNFLPAGIDSFDAWRGEIQDAQAQLEAVAAGETHVSTLVDRTLGGFSS